MLVKKKKETTKSSSVNVPISRHDVAMLNKLSLQNVLVPQSQHQTCSRKKVGNTFAKQLLWFYCFRCSLGSEAWCSLLLESITGK